MDGHTICDSKVNDSLMYFLTHDVDQTGRIFFTTGMKCVRMWLCRQENSVVSYTSSNTFCGQTNTSHITSAILYQTYLPRNRKSHASLNVNFSTNCSSITSIPHLLVSELLYSVCCYMRMQSEPEVKGSRNIYILFHSGRGEWLFLICFVIQFLWTT